MSKEEVVGRIVGFAVRNGVLVSRYQYVVAPNGLERFPRIYVLVDDGDIDIMALTVAATYRYQFVAGREVCFVKYEDRVGEDRYEFKSCDYVVGVIAGLLGIK